MANMEGKTMLVVCKELVMPLKKIAAREEKSLQDVVDYALRTFIEANK